MKIQLFLFALLCLTACAKKGNDNNAYLQNYEAIPLLLDRNEALIVPEEWANTQSQYGVNRDKVLKNPKDAEATLKLAEVFIAEARVTGEHGHYYPAALKMTDQALTLSNLKSDQKFRALALKAGVQLSLHQFKAALETGKIATELNPHNAHIRGVLVDAQVELGNYVEAVAEADKMIAIRPDLRSYARVSYLREIHGDVPGAKEALQMAINAGLAGTEERSWAMLTYGNLLHEYGESAEAEAVFHQILIERPNYPFAIAALAQIHADAGDEAKAETELKQAIAIIPEVGFYQQLAQLYQKTNRIKEANDLIPDILEMLADDTKAGHVMDMAYVEVHGQLANDWEKARVYAEKEYAARPKNIDVNLLMAKVAKAQNRTADARKYVNAAKLTNSKRPDLAQL
jgi:tetratricopeptide (TPR) repeat protein